MCAHLFCGTLFGGRTAYHVGLSVNLFTPDSLTFSLNVNPIGSGDAFWEVESLVVVCVSAIITIQNRDIYVKLNICNEQYLRKSGISFFCSNIISD